MALDESMHFARHTASEGSGAGRGLGGPSASRRKSLHVLAAGPDGGPTSGRAARRRSGAFDSGLVCRTGGRASGPAPGDADRAADRRRRDLRRHSTCLEERRRRR